ncbi:hypothetical protein AGMMS49592_0270 [Endomicrobiia bacterium]|nr:hypothetical protein AGMMS49592_0270 [Endomicrobiia bacterium]
MLIDKAKSDINDVKKNPVLLYFTTFNIGKPSVKREIKNMFCVSDILHILDLNSEHSKKFIKSLAKECKITFLSNKLENYNNILLIFIDSILEGSVVGNMTMQIIDNRIADILKNKKSEVKRKVKQCKLLSL